MVVLGRAESEASGLGSVVHACGVPAYGPILVVTAAADDTCALLVALALVLADLLAEGVTCRVAMWRATNRCAAFIS